MSLDGSAKMRSLPRCVEVDDLRGDAVQVLPRRNRRLLWRIVRANQAGCACLEGTVEEGKEEVEEGMVEVEEGRVAGGREEALWCNFMESSTS